MRDTPVALEQSDALHTRVQDWIRGDATDREPFERLALDIARFQAQFIPGYARLVAARHARLDSLDTIAPVPTDAFRLSRIAVHPAELDAVRYATSGTTSANRGVHAMRRVDTYRCAAVAGARAALLDDASSAVVGALLPGMNPQTSSLAAMAQMFIEAFEPATDTKANHATSSPWLMNTPDVVAALLARANRAKALDLPLLIVATTLALAHLLEQLDDRRLDTGPRVKLMPTGGSKGKALQFDPSALRTRLMETFDIGASQVVGEYGMTELSSQLYEAHPTRRDVAIVPGIYYAPAWLHICPVDSETLLPVEPGTAGLARFIDLANVDSAVCIVTQDLIRAKGDGFELLGRQPGAPSRGCSLSTEEWLNAQVEW